jgi:hypothetical protein
VKTRHGKTKPKNVPLEGERIQVEVHGSLGEGNGISGRPTVFTEEVKARILNLIEMGNYALTAARAAGVRDRTWEEFGRQARRDVEAGIENERTAFYAQVQEYRARAQGRFVTIISLAAEQDWRAAAFFLERSDPNRWGNRAKQTTTLRGDKNNPVVVETVDAAKDELLRRLEQIRQRHDEVSAMQVAGALGPGPEVEGTRVGSDGV